MELAEAISKSVIDPCTLVLPMKEEIKGRLNIGSHHLIFSAVSSGAEAETPSKQLKTISDHPNEFTILHRCVDLVSSESASGRARLTLKCKHFLEIGLYFTRMEDCNAVARSVEIISSLANVELEYPFYYRCPVNLLEDGWEAFSESVYFSRLQIITDQFRISVANQDYNLCSTYPKNVVVPKNVNDDVIKLSASFREGGRFPVLAYFHKPTLSCIVRSSQPLVGTGGRRCTGDEAFLNAFLGPSAKGFIIDTRSHNAAQAAKNKGGGFEPDMFYPRWKRIHRPIPRWQVLQDCLAKLIEACTESGDKWLSKLASSNWLTFVSDALSCACLTAQCIDRDDLLSPQANQEVSVIVHGGEGMDMTLIVTSLAQIILDPDARTIRGLEAIIERDWVSGGHPFRTRNSHSAYAKTRTTNNLEAPTFLLFLDCVWQIWRQFPESFEFTENLLVQLFQHSYFSDFGTFLCDFESERKTKAVTRNTVSLWSYINRPEMLNKMLNVFYEPNKSIIWPSVAPQSLGVWERVYMAWTLDWTAQNAAENAMKQIKLEQKENMYAVAKLRRQVKECERDVQNGELTSPL